MLTEALEVMKYVKTSAGRSSLRVVFEDTNNPRHDGSTIYLPSITAKTTKADLEGMMASTDHEVAHDLYSDFDILAEKCIDTSGSILGLIVNVIEDSRVNAIEAEKYEGFKMLWDKACPKHYEKLNKKAAANPADDFTKLLQALFQFQAKADSDLFPMCALAAESSPADKDLEDILNPFKGRLNELRPIIDKKPGSKAAYELACDIYRALGGDPEAEEKKQRDKRKAKEAAGDGEDGDPAEEVEGSPSDKDGGGKSAEDSDTWDIAKIKVDKDVVEELIPEHTKMRKMGINAEFVRKAGSSWTMTPYDLFEVVNYCKQTTHNLSPKILTETSSAKYFLSNFSDMVEGKANAPEMFANQVRRAIQIRARSRQEFGVKKGKLDQSRLSRIIIPSPGFNERIFKRKITSDVLDAAVTVLVDMSGSMSGAKALYACEATMLLNHTFNVLNIPVEILGFTDALSSYNPGMFVYKDFDTKVPDETLKYYFAQSSGHMHGNPDGENIAWAHNRLIKRKEKKKLLIVMSDGQPAASKSFHGIGEFTRKVIQEIENSKTVDIYGLGLLSRSVEVYYKAHSVVSKVEQIPLKLLDLIERKLLNEH